MKKLTDWIVPGIVALALLSATACSKNYQPPSHTYTGFPEYHGIGVSVWGGVATPVLIGGPVPVVVPEPSPDVEIKVKQMPLDPIF